VDNIYFQKVQDFLLIFSSILWEAMPFIVLGAIIAGILEEMVPQSLIARIVPRNRFIAIAVGGLLGLLFPMCECGILPMIRRLLRKGLPLSCCTAYLLAGPIINGVVILSTIYAFSGAENHLAGQFGSWTMTGLRVGLGYLIAVNTSLIVDWQYRKHGVSLLTPQARPSPRDEEAEENAYRRQPLAKRLNNIAETALSDFVDIAAFLILGALLAASVRVFLPPEKIALLSHQHIISTILIMMLLAILLTLCSEADAFVAASFSTLAPAAKLAFLVLGPMMDLKLTMLYTRVFRLRLIVTIFGAILIQTFVYSLVVHYIWQWYQNLPAASTP
jgi:uncharacterized protein